MSDDMTQRPGGRPDPMRTLTAAEVAAQAPAGWTPIMGSLRARYRTGDFATGLRLVNLIGESAERWDHHPDVTLTYGDVIVSLVSHDVRGITSRDLRMARLSAEHAAHLGLEPDVAGLTQIDPGLDTAHADEVAPFYSALFAAPLRDGEPVDPSGQTPTVWWQAPDDADSPDGDAADDSQLPPADHEQRWHFDVWVAAEAAEQRLAAVLDAGGRLVSDAHAPSFWVVEDADGNRHCICTPAGR
ncbi:4a-hydroxytetrahydrobiopterin dehydratase [Dermacoccus nishinomiyaensis]|uniref:4a-hydroxytetrahydrobiopterin dehydratase n=1 Tax=Dermacoccus nishinomiyaensis TaxID=1274 RepID=UPI000E1B7DDC|nr:4a-hydroxytetrahydrobiopterin dehydratase [Dermacoccus nishinomiyaensis]QQY23804.1 4a-hydroxytetrahydrobiopterin dehydratase [Dermacoccus nishinomiyaensis]